MFWLFHQPRKPRPNPSRSLPKCLSPTRSLATLSHSVVTCITAGARPRFLESKRSKGCAAEPAHRDSELSLGRYSSFPGGLVQGRKFLAPLLGLLIVLMMSGTALAQKAPAGPVILKGAPMGAVKFDHSVHVKVAGKCVTCHHASKPAKPLTSPQEACTDCHTRPPTPPVTTNLQGAFHNPTATAGLCIDCHKNQNVGGKATPVKCMECHQKANG